MQINVLFSVKHIILFIDKAKDKKIILQNAVNTHFVIIINIDVVTTRSHRHGCYTINLSKNRKSAFRTRLIDN